MEYKTNRRNFLKTSVAGATGIMVGSIAKETKAQNRAWYPGRKLNPSIDNLRVICCHDSQMVSGTMGSTFSSQNSAIDTDRVQHDLDLMAKYLAQKDTSAEAWQTIFQQPSGKQWSEVKVAFKVNCINTAIMHHIAIIDKIAEILNSFGVPYSNMTIFDACHNANGKYNNYVGNGLPSGMVVWNETKNTNDYPKSSVPVGSGNMSCTKLIAENSGGQVTYNTDILVNCAVNKGHSQTSNNGGTTLTMKNHIGTLKFGCPNITQLTDINNSETIIGGTPPRQQLCIIDSIIASVGGPGGGASHEPYRIVMGTFGPAVDYLTVKFIREPQEIMNDDGHNQTLIKRYLSDFDYTDQEIKDLVDLTPDQNNGKGWLEFDPSNVGTIPDNIALSTKQTLTFTVKGSHFKTVTKKVNFNNQVIKNVSIVDLKGRTIRNLSVPATGRKTIAWNGLNETGKPVRSGKYILNIQSSKSEKAVSFTLQK